MRDNPFILLYGAPLGLAYLIGLTAFCLKIGCVFVDFKIAIQDENAPGIKMTRKLSLQFLSPQTNNEAFEQIALSISDCWNVRANMHIASKIQTFRSNQSLLFARMP